jgi:hypothetical protein
LIFFARENLSQDSPHDLTTSRLWQVGNHKDGLWCCERTNALSYLKNEILPQLIVDLKAILDGHKRIDGLSRKLVMDTNNCRFSNSVVLN